MLLRHILPNFAIPSGRRRGKRHRSEAVQIETEHLEDRRLLASQIVAANPASPTSTANGTVVFDVEYSTIDPINAKTTGLAFRLHYNSSELTPDMAAITSSAFAGAVIQDNPDDGDLDSDSNTDRFINALWQDVTGNFPAGVDVFPTNLLTATFATTAAFDGETLRFTENDTAVGFDFVGDPVVITVDSGTRPTATITPDGTANNGNPLIFTVQFSEAVTGLEAADFVVTNGTIGEFFVADDADTYRVAVIPATLGDVTITLPADSAINSNDEGNVATSATVTSQTDPTLTPPVLDAVNLATGERQPTLTWSEVDGTTNYEVWVGRVRPSDSRVLESESVVSTNEWTPGNDLDPAFYRVWVRSIDANGIAGPWSDSEVFDVRPTLVSPLMATFERRPTFEWNAIPNAPGYEIFLRTADSTVGVNGEIIIDDLPANETSWTPDTDLPNGPISWWIRTSDAVFNRGWSEGGRISVSGQTRVTSASDSLIEWESVTGAGRYILHVADAAGNVVLRENDLTAPLFVPTALTTGVHRAWIKAIDAANNSFDSGVWSLPFEFTV